MGIARARARRGDPVTSHIAADSVEASGKARSQRALCFKAALDNPGLTAAELADVLCMERHIPSRRLPELREAGFVVNGPARICRVMKSKSMTWYAAHQREAQQLLF